jgi:hypothetical protein
MKDIENKIESYIRESKQNDLKILYRVRPIYKDKNKVPTGVLIEIAGINCEFNVCKFY